MKKSKRNQAARQQLLDLADSLVLAGITSGETDILMIGNGIKTLLSASENEQTMDELNALLLRFCVKQIKRQRGVTETAIAMEEMFREMKNPVHLN